MSKPLGPTVHDYLNSRGTRLKADFRWDFDEYPELSCEQYVLAVYVDRCKVKLDQPGLTDDQRRIIQEQMDLAWARLLAHKLAA